MTMKGTAKQLIAIVFDFQGNNYGHSKNASEGDECLVLSCSVLITIATSLSRNIVKLLHDVKV